MSKSRMVNTRFWSDSFVVDKLNALDRYLYLYLLTNERTNIIGIYELSLRTAAFETGIEREDLQKMLSRLSPKVEYFDGWVYIRRFTDHQQSNPSVDKGILREFFLLPMNVINRVKELGVDSPKLQQGYDMLAQAQTDSDSLSQSAGNLTLTKPNLTKPNGNTSQTATQPDLSPAPSNKISSKEVQEVFEYYITCFGADPSRTKLTDKRKKQIQLRLKDAGVDMLKNAIINTSNSLFHTGDNERGWKANLDFIIRSYEQVERLAGMDAAQSSALPRTLKPTEDEINAALDKL